MNPNLGLQLSPRKFSVKLQMILRKLCSLVNPTVRKVSVVILAIVLVLLQKIKKGMRLNQLKYHNANRVNVG